jgi:hypothetical protein
MDVSGGVSSLSTNGSWSADQGTSTIALGSFTDTLICNSGCGPELTAIFSGTDLVANYTLLNGDIVGFSAANTSNGFFADNEEAPIVTPLPAALPLFATGLGALGLLGWRRKRKAVAARSQHLIGFRRDRREAVFLCVPSMIDSLEV